MARRHQSGANHGLPYRLAIVAIVIIIVVVIVVGARVIATVVGLLYAVGTWLASGRPAYMGRFACLSARARPLSVGARALAAHKSASKLSFAAKTRLALRI